jgi:Lsr2
VGGGHLVRAVEILQPGRHVDQIVNNISKCHKRHDRGMASDTAEIRAWARENGWDVTDRGRLPIEVKDAYYQDQLQPLPGDGDDLDDVEDGDDVGLPPVPEPRDAPDDSSWWEPPGPPEGPPVPDPGPAKIERGAGRGKSGGRKPTAAIAADIRGKVGMMIDVPARLWAVRDPVCGGAAVAQSAAMADAWTAIILDSPDLVAWFTGPAGGFMKWVDVLMATYPVAMTVYAHHIAHSIETPGSPDARPERQYAA